MGREPGNRMFRRKEKPEEGEKEELLEVDLERGILARKEDGARVIAMGSHGWATMEKELDSTFMTGAAVILQRMGYAYGRAMGRAAKHQEIGPEHAFDAIQTMARESGWGGFTLNSGDLNSGEARIVVKNCFFCLHASEAEVPVCHVLAGLVGGMVDEIIGVSHRVIEEKCIAKGDAVCEILIERLA